jgi:5'-3' exonuclease
VLAGERVVQVDRRQKKLLSEAVFRAERGLGLTSMPDFLALTGDSADGIPGLAGFGRKSAALLLEVYERLERIPADPFQWQVKPRGAIQLRPRWSSDATTPCSTDSWRRWSIRFR